MLRNYANAGHREDNRGTDYFLGGGTVTKGGEALVADTDTILFDRNQGPFRADWDADATAFADGALIVFDITTDLALSEWARKTE